MKSLFFYFLMIPALALSAECEVAGISDSPQRMNCLIYSGHQILKLRLYCDDGQYKIIWRKKEHLVEQAYHEEVERGSNPLVFLAQGLSLTTISFRFYSQAEVLVKQKRFKGLCFVTTQVPLGGTPSVGVYPI